MRKALALFVAVCMFLSLCTGVLTPLSTARAGETPAATLSLTSDTGTTRWVNGQTLDLTLNINISNASVNALATTVTYDSTVLQVTGAEWTAGNPFTLSTPIELNWATPGSVYIADGQPSGMDGTFAKSGPVAIIHFKTLANAATATPVGFAAGTQIMQPNLPNDPKNVFTGATGVTVEVKAWHITVTAGAHGTVAPYGVAGDVTEAENAMQTFTFTPDSGYEVAAVVVNGTAMPTANSYTFGPVMANQTLGVTFRMNAAAALAAVNTASSASNYAAVTTALVDNADVLGLNLTDYNTLIADRKPAVANDIYCSKPDGGYTLTGLQNAFNAVVATRLVFQNSMILVNAATPQAPLTDLAYVQMLIDNLKTVQYYTYHSGIKIVDKIAQLQALITRYDALPAAGKTAVRLAVSSADYLSSTETLNALSNALAAQETAVAAALLAVNTASPASNYAAVTTALVNNADVLGLDLTSYKSLIPDRQPSVANDIYCSKPNGGYTLTQLQNAFNEIVATRLVFQASLDEVNLASSMTPLTSLHFVTMLIDNLKTVKYYTHHSGMTIADKIAQLQALVSRYSLLPAVGQASVLMTVSSADYASSTLSLNALDAALTTQETAVTAALLAVNTASSASNYAAVTTALVDNADVLGLNLADYNTLIADRKPAVANDIFTNKPSGGYTTLAGLQSTFNAIVATRIVCQNSLYAVNAATAGAPLTNLDYVQDLLTEFNRVHTNNLYTIHSGVLVTDKITALTNLLARYAALSADRQTALLLTLSSADYASSTLSLTALDTALKTQEAITTALLAVNTASPASNYAAVTTALVNNADVLGLDLTSYKSLIPDRQPSVANDIYCSKPNGGYTLTQLQNAFNEIVATRLVFQASLDEVNLASSMTPLTSLHFVTMLIDNLKTVKYYTHHSGMTIADKIAQLQALVSRYSLLPAVGQASVLMTVSSADYASSTLSLNALDAALTTQETAVTAALLAVNTASSASNYAAVTTALVDNADVLGLNLADYNTLIADRKPAVANDIFTNKPSGGYTTLAGLQSTFNAIVATRIVCQNSLYAVNAATAGAPLTNLDYVQDLLTEFNRVHTNNLYTIHSGVLVTDKITALTNLLARYAALSADRQTALLLTLSSADYASSTLSLTALDTALKTQEAITTALLAVNTASPASNYAAVTTALVNNADVLGLDLTSYKSLIPDRQPSVANDIYCSKPNGGYTLTQLQNAFNEIVATRLVFQASLDEVNLASSMTPLTSLHFVTMLIDNLKTVKYYTHHSGMTIADKIAQLQALADRYVKLDLSRETAALLAVSSTDYASSTLSLNALSAALTTQEHDTVTISANGSHGTVTPLGALSVLHGGSVALTVTPDQYYYLYSVTVNGTETAQPVANRNLGSVTSITLNGIDSATTITVNIYRRGDIAGNGSYVPDGSVGIYDVAELIKEWRSMATGLLADLNCDNKVDIIDVSMMMSLWLQP